MFKFLRGSALWILLLPSAVFFTGAASNQAVLITNHDTFPVMTNPYKIALSLQDDTPKAEKKKKVSVPPVSLPPGYLDDTHTVMTSKTHLNFLADIFDLKSEGVNSIGDLLIELSDWLGGFCKYVWLVVVLIKLRRTQTCP